jgi:peptidoglycan/LPS O-acetylase OafA/YrhL
MAPAPRALYRSDIDGLRGIAVLAVVVYHFSRSFFPGGFVGVDIFFVVSGYLISGILLAQLERGAFTLAGFYGRRVRRIFPALLLVLTTTWALATLLCLPADFVQLGKHIAAGAGFVSNLVFWNEAGYFDPVAESKPLLHLWSLGIEEQFYIFWPLLLALAWRFGRRIGSAMLAIFILSFALNLLWVKDSPVATFYSPFTRVWELAVGGLLACVERQSFRSRVPMGGGAGRGRARSSDLFQNAIAITGGFLVASSIALLRQGMPFPGSNAALPVIGTALMIAAGPESWASRKVLSFRPLVLVGLISYPLYLWHWPLLTFWRHHAQWRLEGTSWAGAHPTLISAILVAVAFVLSTATYRLVEKPIRGAPRSKRGRVMAGQVVAMTAVGAIGLLTLATHVFEPPPTGAARLLRDRRDEFHAFFRVGKCLLNKTTSGFGDECVERSPADPDAPLVLLWGDSHAAQYRRVLNGLSRQHHFALAQYSLAACPPVFGFERRSRNALCRLNDDVVKGIIARLRPALAILAADWVQHVRHGALEDLGSTVDVLRRDGVETVVILGPVPRWDGSLVKVLYGEMSRRHLAAVPQRLKVGTAPGLEDLDRAVGKAAHRLGLLYISPYRTLCNEEGCLTWVGPPDDSLTSFDDSHLTPGAARLVVTPAMDDVLRALRSSRRAGGRRE